MAEGIYKRDFLDTAAQPAADTVVKRVLAKYNQLDILTPDQLQELMDRPNA